MFKIPETLGQPELGFIHRGDSMDLNQATEATLVG